MPQWWLHPETMLVALAVAGILAWVARWAFDAAAVRDVSRRFPPGRADVLSVDRAAAEVVQSALPRLIRPPRDGWQVRTGVAVVTRPPLTIHVFNFSFHEPGGKYGRTREQTGILVRRADWQLPTFTAEPTGAGTWTREKTDGEDVPIFQHAEFSRRFHVTGRDHAGVRGFIVPAFAELMLAHDYLTVSGVNSELLIYRHNAKVEAADWPNLVDLALRVAQAIGTEPKGWGVGTVGDPYQVVDDTGDGIAGT